MKTTREGIQDNSLEAIKLLESIPRSQLLGLLGFNTEGERLLALSDVEKKVGFKKSWIYGKISQGLFPKSRAIFGQPRWLESEIDEWIVQHAKLAA